jgi:hypothetical protein
MHELREFDGLQLITQPVDETRAGRSDAPGPFPIERPA